MQKQQYVRSHIHMYSRLMRKFPLGQDRFARQYWLVPDLGSIIVEGVETSLHGDNQLDVREAEDEYVTVTSEMGMEGETGGIDQSDSRTIPTHSGDREEVNVVASSAMADILLSSTSEPTVGCRIEPGQENGIESRQSSVEMEITGDESQLVHCELSLGGDKSQKQLPFAGINHSSSSQSPSPPHASNVEAHGDRQRERVRNMFTE